MTVRLLVFLLLAITVLIRTASDTCAGAEYGQHAAAIAAGIIKTGYFEFAVMRLACVGLDRVNSTRMPGFRSASVAF